MAAGEDTSSTYIKHHLQNLTFGQHPDGTWGIAHGAQEAKEMGFWAIHVDTMFWSIHWSRRLIPVLIPAGRQNCLRGDTAAVAELY
jgi:hypothetical protein